METNLDLSSELDAKFNAAVQFIQLLPKSGNLLNKFHWKNFDLCVRPTYFTSFLLSFPAKKCIQGIYKNSKFRL